MLSLQSTRSKKRAQASKCFLQGTQLVGYKSGIRPWRPAVVLYPLSPRHGTMSSCLRSPSAPVLLINQEKPVPPLRGAAPVPARCDLALPLTHQGHGQLEKSCRPLYLKCNNKM